MRIYACQPRALSELFPSWSELGAPLNTPVSEDSFLLLGKSAALPLPGSLLPPQLNNHGNFIISLSQLTKYVSNEIYCVAPVMHTYILLVLWMHSFICTLHI